MPINNSYSQTPKRIFTNKPFIKGMSYTNADLDPYVCRAVANLELESSNSATKTRLGIKNNAIGNAGETAYAFYNKYVLFSNYVLEDDYNKNITVATSNGLGIRVLDKDLNEHEIYNYIISNNTGLSISNGELSRAGDTGISKTGCSIYALKMNENDIPHCINNEDYSFLFFGIIKRNNSMVYRGMIKLFYHVTANKIIIETITPDIVDNFTVADYGVNIISNNPSVYKDYVTFNEHDFYRDYMGDTTNATDSKSIIDVLTVAMYDHSVESNPYTITSNANMVKGINSLLSDDDSDVYVRPYVALPTGSNYGAIIKATNNYGTELCYNFSTKTFVPASIANISTSSTKSISIPTYAEQNASPYSIDTVIYDEQNGAAPSITLIKIPNMNLVSVYSDTSRIMSDDTNYSDYFEVNKTDVEVYKLNLTASSVATPTMPYTYSTTFNSSKLKYSFYNVVNTSKSLSYYDIVHSWVSQTSYNNEAQFRMHATSADGYINTNELCVCCPIICNIYDPIGNSSFNLNSVDNVVLGNDVYITIYGDTDYFTFRLKQSSYTIERNTPVAIHYNDNDHKQCTVNFGYVKVSLRVVSITKNGSPFSSPLDNQTAFKYALMLLSDTSRRIELNAYSEYVIDSVYDNYCYPHDTSQYEITSINQLSFQYSISLSPASYQGYIDSPYTEASSNDVSVDITNSLSSSSAGSNVVSTLNTSVAYEFTNNNIDTITDTLYDSTHNIEYTYDDITTDLSIADAVNLVQYSSPRTTYATLEITASDSKSGISENFVNVFTNTLSSKDFNIRVKQSAFSDINGSSIKVSVFPITGSTSTGEPPETYFFKETSVVTKNLYTIRTDKFDVIDHNEIAYNYNIKNTATRVCNHLGHIVVWGDNTNSNSLYYSEYGNPSYFPSNYIITLDNPIVYAYPHNGNLIVFTTDDIYMLHSGNVPSTTSTDGSEIAFTQTLVQSNTRIGKENIHTVRSIGKDVFFINNNNNGYLLKSNKYVSNVSDVYLIRVTNQINDLLNDPFNYAKERYSKWIANASFNNTQQLNIEYVKHEYDGGVNIDDPSDVYVIDGDTIEYNNVRYRLASIDTPEVAHDNDPTSSNEYLGPSAKILLQRMIDSSSQVKILDTEDTDLYNRHLAYVSVVIDDKIVSVNDTMLYNGLAKFYDENHNTGYHAYCHVCYSLAKQLHNGLYNKYTYPELTNDYAGVTEFIDIETDTQHSSWNNTEFRLYTYTTNSFIYIFQPIKLNVGKAITIIYKYNIDSKVWITYDVIGFILPSDIINDYNILGFKILTNNDDGLFGIPSIAEFKDKCDTSNVVYIIANNNDYSLSTNTAVNRNINVYFDSGNQSISLMNDKLFREIKLSLGSLPDSLLNMDYSIDFYVDGKLVIPNQRGNCNTHIHHNPVNTHYAGSEENLAGFKKITFFAPSRGRIPRIVFSINCTNDINILEYAIVYMQLNAK